MAHRLGWGPRMPKSEYQLPKNEKVLLEPVLPERECRLALRNE